MDYLPYKSDVMQLDPQQGEFVYAEVYLRNIERLTVVRLTPTQIVLSDGRKVKRPLENGKSCIGESGFWKTYIKPPSPELDEKYKRQELMVYISRFSNDSRLKSLPTEALTGIFNIMQGL